MSDTIVVAMLVSVIAPVIAGVVTSLLHRSEKREDWRRQDEVADRAIEAADLLREATVLAAAETNGRLDTITGVVDEVHVLVNNNMTEALKSELAALIQGRLALREVAALKQSAGLEADPETAIAIAAATDRIAEVAAELRDRTASEEAADTVDTDS
jgi:hypothetical protein